MIAIFRIDDGDIVKLSVDYSELGANGAGRRSIWATSALQQEQSLESYSTPQGFRDCCEVNSRT
jgi:hypothetical protein